MSNKLSFFVAKEWYLLQRPDMEVFNLIVDVGADIVPSREQPQTILEAGFTVDGTGHDVFRCG